MRENKYDDPDFFEKYSRMPRSTGGLDAAGEWRQFRRLFPPLAGRRVLDLGCGYGWHCKYAADNGAARVLGIDISEKMLAEAARRNSHPVIEYRRAAIEDVDGEDNSFDAAVSSLALHYVESFDPVVAALARMLVPGGDFVFSVEHPVFTAQGRQDWIYSRDGREKLCWPVDRYFDESARDSVFLDTRVRKYHRTAATWITTLLDHGFALRAIVEPVPDDHLPATVPGMEDELRRPGMLLLAARKQ